MDIDTKRLKSDAKYWDEVAPEIWATEYNLDDGFFFCPKGHWGMSNGGWVSFYKPSTYDLIKSQSNCVSRPTKPAAPEWDGEIWPIPLGSICECDFCGKWVKGKIVAHARTEDGVDCIFQFDGDWDFHSNPEKFRPIKINEQRERDELVKILRKNIVHWKVPPTIDSCVDDILKAGYRKQERD